MESDNWIAQNLQNALNTWNGKLTEIWQLQKARERHVSLNDIYMDDEGTLRSATDHKPLV